MIRSTAVAVAGSAPALDALDRLQASVREHNVDLERWERADAAERSAGGVRS